jgi:acyl-coenzyme A thioesterase PaaI-like protein
MTSIFQDLFNIQAENTGQGQGIATQKTFAALLNVYGIVHGGDHIVVCNAAMQAAINTNVTLLNSSIEYYSKALLGDELKAIGRIIKDGQLIVFAEADLYVAYERVARVVSIFSRKTETTQLEEASSKFIQEKPSVDFFIHQNCYDPVFSDGDLKIRQVFDATPYSDEMACAQGDICLALQTEDFHKDRQGTVDDSIFMILADDAMGLATASLGYGNVTAKLSCRKFSAVRPGVVLTCFGKVDVSDEKILQATGWIWADNELVASCDGTYVKFQPRFLTSQVNDKYSDRRWSAQLSKKGHHGRY